MKGEKEVTTDAGQVNMEMEELNSLWTLVVTRRSDAAETVEIGSLLPAFLIPFLPVPVVQEAI